MPTLKEKKVLEFEKKYKNRIKTTNQQFSDAQIPV